MGWTPYGWKCIFNTWQQKSTVASMQLLCQGRKEQRLPLVIQFYHLKPAEALQTFVKEKVSKMFHFVFYRWIVFHLENRCSCAFFMMPYLRLMFGHAMFIHALRSHLFGDFKWWRKKMMIKFSIWKYNSNATY